MPAEQRSLAAAGARAHGSLETRSVRAYALVRRNRPPETSEGAMDEDKFNIEVRKFLKEVGITSQREIERAVREAIEAGRIKGNEKLKISARIQIERVALDHSVKGDIALA